MSPITSRPVKGLYIEIDPTLKEEFLKALKEDDLTQRGFFTPIIKKYLYKRKRKLQNPA